MKSRFWNRPAVFGRKMIFEPLEERIVLDAAMDNALHGNPLTHDGPSYPWHENPVTFYGVSSSVMGERFLLESHTQDAAPPTSAVPDSAPDSAAAAPEAPKPDAPSVVIEPAAASSEPVASSSPADKAADPAQHGLDVVLVSDALDGKADIANAASPDAAVVMYSAQTDTLDTINAKLSELVRITGKTIDHLAVASHGDAGALNIGSQHIDASNAQEYQPAFEVLGKNLSPGAQIQFYSCSMAGDDAGKDLVNSIAVMTGADVFASSDTTGAKPNNWTLEYSSNPASSAVSLFDAAKLEKVPGELAQAAITNLSDNPGIDAFPRALAGLGRLPVVNGSQVGFSATDHGAATGYEVYATVSAAPGAGQTQLSGLAPVNPDISEITALNNDIYFVGVANPTVGHEVFRAAGGAQTAVTDFGNGMNGYNPGISQLTSQSNAIYFVGNQPSDIPGAGYPSGNELWRSAGGAPAAGRVTDTLGGSAWNQGNVSDFSGVHSARGFDPGIREVTPATQGPDLYFVADNPLSANLVENTVIQGYEVWRTDGVPPTGPNITNFAGVTNLRGAVSRFGELDAISGYDPHIQELTPGEALNLYFVADDNRRGFEVWMTNGNEPATGGSQRTVNGGITGGGWITNFTSRDPNIHELEWTPLPGGNQNRLHFVADDGTNGYEIWRFNGAAPPVNGTDGGMVTAFGLADPDISQLTADRTTGDLYFVANNGTLDNPDYDIWRVTAAGAAEQVSNFNNTEIVAPAAWVPQPGLNPIDHTLQNIPEHSNPHIKLVTIQGTTLWFEADSLDNHSRELYSVDLTQTLPVNPAQRTDFGLPDPNFGFVGYSNSNIQGVTVAAGNLTFVANGAGSDQEVFTIQNTAPTLEYVDWHDFEMYEDNNNHNIAIDRPNLLRVHDADMNDQVAVTVSVNPLIDGFSEINFSIPTVGNVTATDTSGNGTQWQLGLSGTFDPMTYQRDLNMVLESLQLTPNRDSNWERDTIAGTVHQIHVTLNDGIAPAVTQDIALGVVPVNDQPVLNPSGIGNEFPGTVYGGQYPFPDPGVRPVPIVPQVTTSSGALVFNDLNVNRIGVGDVDAYEILGVGGTEPNGEIHATLTAGAGTIWLPTTTGLTFDVGTANNSQLMGFRGTITNINNALNGMTYTPPAYFVGNTGITVMLDDTNPFLTDPAPNDVPHFGISESDAGLGAGYAYPGGADNAPPPAIRPVVGYVPITVGAPAGDFWGRLVAWP